MTFVEDSRAQSVSRTILVVLRVYLGIVFLVAVRGKLGGPVGSKSVIGAAE
ncbi:MAG: hypothetical protein ACE5MH_11050 [Terriglobia bacterium]